MPIKLDLSSYHYVGGTRIFGFNAAKRHPSRLNTNKRSQVLQTKTLENAIHTIGGRWRALLILSLSEGPKRFSDLEKEIAGISQRMLSLDLRKLEKDGILLRIVIDDVPVKVEYKLTPGGIALSAILHQLRVWEEDSKIKQSAALEIPT